MYTQEEIKRISNNKNVEKCSSTSITYSNDFKVESVKRYYEKGCGPNVIFIDAGFDLDIIGRDKPKSCLMRWRNIYNKNGEDDLIKEKRGSSGVGGKPKTNFKSDKEKIEYLEARVDYLLAKNDFLTRPQGLDEGLN